MSTGLERRMANEERPVLVQSTWMEERTVMRFVLKRMRGNMSEGCSMTDLHDTSYGSEESEASSSEYSALRFRESPVSASSR